MISQDAADVDRLSVLFDLAFGTQLEHERAIETIATCAVFPTAVKPSKGSSMQLTQADANDAGATAETRLATTHESDGSTVVHILHAAEQKVVGTLKLGEAEARALWHSLTGRFNPAGVSPAGDPQGNLGLPAGVSKAGDTGATLASQATILEKGTDSDKGVAGDKVQATGTGTAGDTQGGAQADPAKTVENGTALVDAIDKKSDAEVVESGAVAGSEAKTDAAA